MEIKTTVAEMKISVEALKDKVEEISQKVEKARKWGKKEIIFEDQHRSPTSEEYEYQRVQKKSEGKSSIK